MNNTIETLEEIKKYYAQDIIRGTETGSKRFKAIDKAIANEKALESAEDELWKEPGKVTWDKDDFTAECEFRGFGKGVDWMKPILAKQILKVEALEKSLESVGDVDDMKDTIWDIMQVALDKNHYITKREELEEILLDCKIPELVAAALKPVISKQILKVKELENSMLTKSEFKNILSEFSPSVASDSGQPEWSSRELDKVWDFITGRAKYICSSDDDLRKIKELEAKIKEIENEN